MELQGCMLVVLNVNRELLKMPRYFGAIPEAGQMLIYDGICYSISAVTWLIEDNCLGCNIQVNSTLGATTQLAAK